MAKQLLESDTFGVPSEIYKEFQDAGLKYVKEHNIDDMREGSIAFAAYVDGCVYVYNKNKK